MFNLPPPDPSTHHLHSLHTHYPQSKMPLHVNRSVYPIFRDALSLFNSTYCGRASISINYESSPLPGLFLKALNIEIPLLLSGANAKKDLC